MTVGIVGLGLIGGSMAKSIKARTAHTVFGCDLDQETMMMARMCGAIDAPLTAEKLKECDLVLVAIRPAAAVKWVKEHAEGIRRGAILVDLCGVKRAVVRELAPVAEQYGFAYIGGHPMAGRERGGFTAATDSLYVGASMILTPDKRTAMQLLETLKARDLTREAAPEQPQPAHEKPYDWQAEQPAAPAPAPSEDAEKIATEISDNLEKLIGSDSGAETKTASAPALSKQSARPMHPESATIKFEDLKFGRNYDPTSSK